MFMWVSHLSPLADDVQSLHAECSIFRAPEQFTVRTTPVVNDDWIGRVEAYASLYRIHYSQLQICLSTESAPVNHLKSSKIQGAVATDLQGSGEGHAK